jgi:tetratricopeptide (TPR) repeat protein
MAAVKYFGRYRRFLFLSVVLITVSAFISGCGTTSVVTALEAAEVWYNLGNAYNDLGKHDDAVNAFIRARELEPELFGAGYNLARIYIYLKKYDESSKLLDELLENDPGNRIVSETKAWVYHLQGDNEAALKQYNKILNDSPVNRNSLYNSAMILMEQDEFAEALTRLQKLIASFPDEKTVYFNLAYLEAELGNNENALEWLQKHLEISPDDFNALELSGDIYTGQSRFSGAVTDYRKALVILQAEDGGAESAAGAGDPAAVGRINFKIAEILLVRIEDDEAGLAALQNVKDAEWSSADDFERLLSHEGAIWMESAVEILEDNSVSGIRDEPAVNETEPE